MSEPQFCPQCAAPLIRASHGGKERLACEAEGCDFVYWDNPKPVVAALLEHEGSIILVRNVGWPEKWFGLVTGFLERKETPEEGVLREISEELGLEGEIVELIGLYPFEQMNEIIIAFYVRASGVISLNDEIEEYKAVAPEKLRPWPFGTGKAVKDWIRKYRKRESLE